MKRQETNSSPETVVSWGLWFASSRGIVLVGVIIGVLAAVLQVLGNPPNMGVCVACFERDIVGALGFHRVAAVQYVRPEIIGFVVGSMVTAVFFGEFRPRGGSATILRFFLGLWAMIGALVFLGCPWRVILRLAGGDGNALLGLAGLVVGVAVGASMLRRGYTLGRSHATPTVAGLVLPVLMVVLLVLLLGNVSLGPDAPLFLSSTGPGAQHAAVWISLAVGLLVGALAQRSRFCTMGSIRDLVLIRDFHLLRGVVAMLAAAFVVNLAVGQFAPGFSGQPISHSAGSWNFLGMVLAGLAFVLAGGCPGRQLILAGEGDGDAAGFVAGMMTGAAVAHNFQLAARPDALVDCVVQVGGIAPHAMVVVVVGILFCLVIGLTARRLRSPAPVG